ncbi:FIST C-terminal domain-containing protein [bacterium]|nr:FIST C-terminal domain-containing protein [bacterium]
MSDNPILRVWSEARDPELLVREIQQQFSQLGQPLAGLFLFRCSSLDDQRLGRALREAFECPVASCTTAGEILDEYQKEGTVAVGFSSQYFAFKQIAIPDLRSFDYRSLPGMAQAVLENPSLPGSKSFGVLLVDGLSLAEENLVGQVYRAFRGIPLIGGSAGDSLSFNQTRVYCEGSYLDNAATFTVIESLLPFEIFRVQHFKPSKQDMVITNSDLQQRIVYEIDGAPAAPQLASLLGLSVEQLNPQTFSKHPMMLQIGEEWYVRSIQKVNPDGSLSFFCAIDDGLPLTVASGVGLVETLEGEVERIEHDFKRVHLTLGIDCILRRLEIEEKGLHSQVAPLLKRLRFAGFSSYGEQIRSLHVNQTLTAVTIGEKC